MSGMAEVLAAHQPTTGMQVASGVTCRCGYWNGEERAGIDRPAGMSGLIWHQSQMLTAAGFGPVKEAKAVTAKSCPTRLMDGRNEIRCWLNEGHEGDCK